MTGKMKKLNRIVLVTGGFDPVHSGHIAYIRSAKELGDKLFIGLNSDDWLTRKKGKPFMPFYERETVLDSIKGVDGVFGFDDSDGSAKDAINILLNHYKNDHIVFANGGDRTSVNIPEMDIESDRLSFEFGVGGFYKANSSSWLLNDWKTN